LEQQIQPNSFFERVQNLIHAVWVFEIWHTFAAVEYFKGRMVPAMIIRVKYSHGKTILPASVCDERRKMDIFEAIQTRHSVKKVKADSLPRDVIEKLLDAGNRAPNHYKVRPWRFIVLTGNGRGKLGDVMAASLRDRQPDLPQEGLDKTRALPLRAPVVVAVGVDKPVEAKVLDLENYAAVSAACQNILLVAHALGLGAIWRTGDWARDEKVKEFLGLTADQHIAGFIYVGYPEAAGEPAQRPSFEDRTVWMG
jgi:nitroreductase